MQISRVACAQILLLGLFLLLKSSMTDSFAAASSTLTVNPAAGTYGGTTTLQATLTSGNSAIGNKQITFSLNGANVGSAITNSQGVAILNNVSLLGIQAKVYSTGVGAVFAGTKGIKSSQGTANLTVNKKPASVTPNAAGKIYGTSDPALTGTLSGFLTSDNVTAAYSRTAGQTAGSYAISATLSSGALNNYQITYNTAAFTINPAQASVTPNAAGKIYGSSDPTLTGTLSGFLAGDNVTAAYNRTAGQNAGTYVISAALAPPGVLSNYQITYNTAVFTINPAQASVTPNAASKIYGSSDPTLTGTLSGFLASDNVTAAYSRTGGQNAGTYVISATLAPSGVLSNYQITYNTAAFTITPAPLTITANNATKLYGTANPAFTASYTGLVNADTASSLAGTLSFSTNATNSSPVDTYPVTPGGLTSPNYTITFANGVLNVVYAYVTDKNIYTPPDYLTFQPPVVGTSYTDTPGFYTPIERLSDSMNTPNAGNGASSVVTIMTEYSTMSPFNQDNSRLLLVHLAYFGLYDGSGAFLNNLPFEISASAQPRWSRTDPNVLYYVYSNQLKQYNVSTNTASVVHTFSEYSAVTGKGKSDISFDGDHFVLVGDNEFVFVYEISTDSKGTVFDSGGTAFNAVFITPDNNVMISWYTVGTNRNNGIELFDRNLNFRRQVAPADGHMDMTRDTNGDEVAVWANAADPHPICNNGVVKIRLADATQTCLQTFDWSLALHISATDNSGWVFVETYAPGDPIPPSGWFAYTDELMQVKLDGTATRRLLHHRSRPLNSYTYQPKLSVSRDGSKLVYASNFGLQQILGYPREYSDAYMVDISVVSSDTLGTASTGPTAP